MHPNKYATGTVICVYYKPGLPIYIIEYNYCSWHQGWFIV